MLHYLVLAGSIKEVEHQPDRFPLHAFVVAKGFTVLKRPSSVFEDLRIGRDALLALDLDLNVADGFGRLDLEGNFLAFKILVVDLYNYLFVFLSRLILSCNLCVYERC